MEPGGENADADEAPVGESQRRDEATFGLGSDAAQAMETVNYCLEPCERLSFFVWVNREVTGARTIGHVGERVDEFANVRSHDIVLVVI